MIAKSDLVILTVSAAALAFGIFRWQLNTAVDPIVAAPVVDPASPRSPAEIEATIDEAPRVTRLPGQSDESNVSVANSNSSSDVVGGTAEGVATGTDESASPNARPVDTPAGNDERATGLYIVRAGDFLGRIAEEFGTTVAVLKDLNGLESNTIQVGEELRYPLPAN